MIKIARLPKPANLHKNASEWTKKLCEARRQYYHQLKEHERAAPDKKGSPPSRPNANPSWYGHNDVKKQLGRMFGKKCTYRESIVTIVSYQHVEHFRPQSVYASLAYDWDNLL